MSEAVKVDSDNPAANCWMCHGWGAVDKQDTGETAWSDSTGGPEGQRFAVYRLVPAFGTWTGDLIDCPVCRSDYEPLPDGTSFFAQDREDREAALEGMSQ